MVLMDVQMPVMDGIEATRELRKMPQFNHLPIVALTAGAFKAQQDAARTAGMSHFISKPFDVPTTVALIQRLTHKPTSTQWDAQPQTEATQIDAAAELPAGSADTAVLDLARGMKIWSDAHTYREYLQRFTASYGNTVDLINDSLAVDDRTAAAGLAHKLAGVAGNLALPETHRLALEAERILSAQYDATLALARLRDALNQVSAAIARFAAEPATDSALSATRIAPESLNALKTQLQELLAALDSDNPAPVTPILHKLTSTLPETALAGIRECVRSFDFRGAEAQVVHLAREHGITLGQ